MKIKLEHPFIKQAHDVVALLDNCKKLSTFCSRLEKQSILFPDRYDPDKYKGDGLELFAEALIKLSPTDNRIGVGEYQVVTEGDVGVDGFGTGIDGAPMTVQVKYRGRNDKVLTANNDHLSNFVMNSYRVYGVPVNAKKKHMVIITTAKGLHHFTDNEMFGNEVLCIGYEQLRDLVDNNQLFWDSFRQLLSEAK